LQPSSAEVGNAAGNGAVGVIAPEGCDWVASSNDTWLSISSANSGAGNGTINYTFSANPANTVRVGSLTIAGQTFELKQAGTVTASCNYSLNPNSAETGSAAGNGTVSIIAPEGCDWVASSNDAWLSISSDISGAGNGTVSYAFSANSTDAVRVGSLTIAGQIFELKQANTTTICSYSLEPSGAIFDSDAGTGSVAVTAPAGCSWTVLHNTTWLNITAGNTGTGNGTVNYAFEANSDTEARIASFTIAEQVFELQQNGMVCNYSMKPNSATFGSASGTGSVAVTTMEGCSWTASSNDAWLSIISGTSGAGNSTIHYGFDTNPNTIARVGSLSIAGYTFTINQLAAKSPEVTDSESTTLVFDDVQHYYQVGEQLTVSVKELLPSPRQKLVDLWLAVTLPDNNLIFIADPSKPEASVEAFKTNIELTDNVHALFSFTLPPGMTGNYRLHAFYVEPKTQVTDLNPPIDKLQSNLAEVNLQVTAAPQPFKSTVKPSGVHLRLNQLIYEDTENISVELDFNTYSISKNPLWVMLASPNSDDLEALRLIPDGSNRYITENPIPIIRLDTQTVQQNDQELHVRPGEILIATYYVDHSDPQQIGISSDLISDIAWLEGTPEVGIAAHTVLSELQYLNSDANDKPLGILLPSNGLPLQIPVNELIIQPQDTAQLQAFLEETGGQILLSDRIAQQDITDPNQQPSYLIQIDPAQAELTHLPQLRVLFGETGHLYVSSEAVLQLYMLALQYQLEGYRVGVNPRLQYADMPSITEARSAVLTNTMLNMPFGCDRTIDFDPTIEMSPDPNVCILNVPRMWAYNALWDGDEQRINLGVLDQGFAVNPDFRQPASGAIRQCDLEGSNLLEGLFTGIRCDSGAAESPPTVGNSLFGGRSWHGTGVVTAAAGVINNDWGATGVGGQVAVPMLYRMGLASYAFEMGLGIRQAVADGASCINISAGYPCRIVTNIGIHPNICSVVGRAALCATIIAATAAATALICASTSWIPIVGIIVCGAATTVVVAETQACLALLIPGDLRTSLDQALDIANAQGVPVVASAGNALSIETIVRDESIPLEVRNILRDVLATLINFDEHRIEQWQFIPAIMPQSIAVGAASSFERRETEHNPAIELFQNLEFFGTQVDIWAPVGSSYWRPPNINRLSTPAENTHIQDPENIGATSGAAAYISGLITAIQAINPTLNPRNSVLTAAQRAAIPERIREILVSTAFSRHHLDSLGHADPSADPSIGFLGERRNLVNSSAALRVAALEVIPNFADLGYDSALNFDEANPIIAADEARQARQLNIGVANQQRGTILTIRGERGVSNNVDSDWFSIIIPSSPAIYQAVVSLQQPFPEVYGELLLGRVGDFDLISPVTRTPSTQEESRIFLSKRLFHNSRFNFRVHGRGLDDNVYKLTLLRIDTMAIPDADRFDINDPRVTPPESRPDNNIPERAVHLGEGEFNWREVETGPDGSRFQIQVPDLNIHNPTDIDWFELLTLPSSEFFSGPGCQPALTIHFNDDAILTVGFWDRSGAFNTISTRETSPVVLPSWVTSPLLLRLAPRDPNTFVAYELELEYSRPNDRICELGKKYDLLESLLEGRRFLLFPSLFPDRPNPTELGFPEVDQLARDHDSVGRVTTPDSYLINWRGQENFTISAELSANASLRMRLRDIQGNLITEVASTDLLAEQAGVTSRQRISKSLNGDTVLLLLEVEQLPVGEYLLEISHAQLGTEIQLDMPEGTIGYVSDTALQLNLKDNVLQATDAHLLWSLNGMSVDPNQPINLNQQDNIKLKALIYPDSAHVEQAAKLLIIGVYHHQQQEIIFVRKGDVWNIWNPQQEFDAVENYQALPTSLEVDVLETQFIGVTGQLSFYVGYQQADKLIVFNKKPLTLSIQ